MHNRDLSGTIHYLKHEGQALRGNPLGDPASRTFPVYLPPGYDDSDENYPTIYALAGFTGTGLNMPNFSAWEESLPEMMDDLITSGKCPPVIVVMPDCFTSLGGSQYLNSTAIGRYEDYLIDDLIPFVDKILRTKASGSYRGVVGKSSGGFGALSLVMRNPGRFAAAASHSGDLYFQYCYMKDFAGAINALNQAGSIEDFLTQFHESKMKGKQIPTLNIIAMAAAYSPDGSDIILPFKLPTGELDEAVWARWLAHDPVNMLEKHGDALRDLKLLFIDAGKLDEYGLHIGARIFCERLEALNISHIHEEHEDGHFGINYRYKRSLELMTNTLSDIEA